MGMTVTERIQELKISIDRTIELAEQDRDENNTNMRIGCVMGLRMARASITAFLSKELEETTNGNPMAIVHSIINRGAGLRNAESVQAGINQ